MTQPNEQLIEEWKNIASEKHEELCKLTKQFGEEIEKSNRLTKELDSAYANIRNVNAMLDTREAQWIAALAELEQVKAERDEFEIRSKEGWDNFWNCKSLNDSLRTELSTKNKVLEWYEDEGLYDQNEDSLVPEILDDRGQRARSILSQYKGEVSNDQSPNT
jgi:chromosome segregation ATPase